MNKIISLVLSPIGKALGILIYLTEQDRISISNIYDAINVFFSKLII